MYADDNGNGIETDGHVPHFAEWDHYSFVGGHGGRDGRVQWEGEQKHPYPFRFTRVAETWQYLVPWARVGMLQADSQDAKVREELWTWLEEQVAGRYCIYNFLNNSTYPGMIRSRQ
jgi:hypothetical protein